MSSTTARKFHSRERGAALVVGLLLLVIITLLAVTGMTTANTELIMAGNEQQRQHGSRAAEIGIDVAIDEVETVGTSAGVCSKSGSIEVFGAPSDHYTTATTYVGSGGLVPGYGVNNAEGNHFAIRAMGAGARGARTEIHQGVVVITSLGGGAGGALGPLITGVTTCVPDDPE